VRSKERKWYTINMDIISKLRQLQSSSFVFYTKAHGYHWNVEGVLFKELHAFFKEIYEDAFDSIDTYAEWSRKLGSPAVFQIDEILQNSNIKYDFPTNSPLEMMRNLLDSNNKIINDLKDGFEMANSLNEQGLANFFAERIDQHQFWSWQLSASLKTSVN
jgi:starvation-inducible DNA-binding protein